MKKLLLLVMLIPMMVSAQWGYETVNRGVDKAYKIAYTKRVKGAYLKLENVDDEIVMYIQGFYFCDDLDTEVDVSYNVNGVWNKYTVSGIVSSDETTVFIEPNMLVSDMQDDFKAATSVQVIIRQINCEEQIYEFSMAGSTLAFNFMK
jgi:hypothetical protein